MGRIIKAKALQDRRTVALARWLLGKHLVRRHAGGRRERWLITEVEAYHGESDLACHARAGRTRRTEVLYGAGGRWYVYLCYGMHEMLNLVSGPADWPAAILIRGVAGVSGPGRLTRRLAIDRTLNGAAAARGSGLWLEDHGVKVPRRLLRATPRIGVDYAGPIWSKKPWRFTFDPAGLTVTVPVSRPARSTAKAGDSSRARRRRRQT